jgi:hypothetical protein
MEEKEPINLKNISRARNRLKEFSEDEVFRQAAVIDLIDDPKLWFDFTRIRNKTANFFDEEGFQEMVNILPTFKKELDTLIERLQKNYTFDE